MRRNLVAAACLDALAASLRQHYPDMSREVAIDASDMPAYATDLTMLGRLALQLAKVRALPVAA